MKYLFLLFLFLTSVFAIEPTLVAQKDSLHLAKMKVDILVVGNIATTTFDLTYTNPHNRDLKATFSMPLAEGQVVSRYALEINGILREGVIAPKVKARQAFEAVVAQKIDPALANMSKGNNFTSTIYPIPAKGSKRVLIALSQTLDNNIYLLPLQSKAPIDNFILDIKILKGRLKKDEEKTLLSNLHFKQDTQAYFLHKEEQHFSMKETLRFTLPKLDKNEYQLYTQTLDEKQYFYLNVLNPKSQIIKKKEAKNIHIYWDNSLSASSRNIKAEIALLKSYLESNSQTKEISLHVFNYRLHEAKHFSINNDASALIQSIKGLKNDGATMLSELKFKDKSDEILLFSDAVSTLGTHKMPSSSAPIYTISSSAGANYPWLINLAQQSQGTFINLALLSQKDALSKLNHTQEQFLSFGYDKNDFEALFHSNAQNLGKMFQVTGILKSKSATLKLRFGKLHTLSHEQSYLIEAREISQAKNIANIWAKQKINALLPNAKENKDAIYTLSQKYNILTANTAFIILDSLEDYLKYHIIPPTKAMRQNYFAKVQSSKKDKKKEEQNIFISNLKRIKKLHSWYLNPPSVKEKSKSILSDLFVFSEAPLAMSSMSKGTSSLPRHKSEKSIHAKKTSASIKILAWLPNAPYMKKLRKTAPENFDDMYFDLKKQHKNRPAFYIQVADYLFSKGKTQKAIRILSNAIELDLENAELLKVVAKRLLDEKAYHLAEQIYQEIKSLRPEEPQSYRDLALLYTQQKKYQKALDTYSYILAHSWGRFEEIKDTIFNEYNALISQHKAQLSLKGKRQAYIYPMPLDVRITVTWSSNNNDIDLWVIDPNGEKCYYAHPNTQIGGKISKDFTRGYGPEEFTVKNAKRGFYSVYLHYFAESRQSITGPVNVFATLTTNYGKDNEASQSVMIQLDKSKEKMQIGLLEFN